MKFIKLTLELGPHFKAKPDHTLTSSFTIEDETKWKIQRGWEEPELKSLLDEIQAAVVKRFTTIEEPK